MFSFKEWLLSEQSKPMMPQRSVSEKPKWRASKKDALNYWRSLPIGMPVRMLPIPYNHKGSTYGEDGIRITGSRPFVSAILSRLKDLLGYESRVTKLQTVFRGTQYKNSRLPDGMAYVFYVQSKYRSPKARQSYRGLL